MQKNWKSRYLGNLYFFYSHLGYRIFLVVLFSIFIGILDGFGLTMFLPLLQLVDGEPNNGEDGLGNLNFLIKMIEGIGFSLTLNTILLFLVIFFTLKGLFRFLGQSYLVIVQQYFVRNLRIKLANGLKELSFRYFVTSDIGRIQNTLTGEIFRVTMAFQCYFKSIEQGILVAVYLTFALFVNTKFAILVTFGGVVSSFIYRFFYRKTKVESIQLTKDTHQFQGQLIQYVSNFKYLKATGSLEDYYSYLKNSIFKIERSRKNIGILNASLIALREPLMIIIVITVIYVQVNILNGMLASIMVSLLFFYRALSSLLILQNQWNKFIGVIGSLENLKSFLEELLHNRELKGKMKIRAFQNSIILEKLHFSYDGSNQIIKDINLKIIKKHTVAFVGESGSGKTTLVNIIAGLMPVDKGRIVIDGIVYSELNIITLQRRIGYITQEPVIFNDTIYNNVTLWSAKTKENLDRYESAIRRASINSFIDSLTQKDNTILGNNGINLSGGQKQRLSIARELYKNIEILIMDEATSALDSETERLIQENIDSLQGTYTILIIAHRLSTIKKADQIVLMEKGRIKRIGTYNQLINKEPSFKRMVDLQEL